MALAHVPNAALDLPQHRVHWLHAPLLRLLQVGLLLTCCHAVQSLAQEMGVIFMCGLTHSNDTTGKDRRRYGFRHFFNAYMSGRALGPVLEKEMGKDRRAYHLTADYTWGWTQEESMKDTTEAMGWQTVAAVKTPLGAGDFSQYITPVLDSGADVLILNHYGKDMVNSLTQAVQFGMRDMQKTGRAIDTVALALANIYLSRHRLMGQVRP